MKKCPYCGKEYSDDVERCLTDNELLLGGEPPPAQKAEETSACPSIPPLLEPTTLPPNTHWTDRRLRIFEVTLVCIIAFGGFIFSSGHYLLFGSSGSSVTGSSASGAYGWLFNCLREVSALGLLWYVLIRRGQSFSNLGLPGELKDIGRSIGLLFIASLAFYGVYAAMHFTGLTTVARQTSSVHVEYILFGGGISFATMLFQFLNPFFEELIVRAYVMTEIKQLTRSMAKAVIVSTVLQISYHLYQGVPMAFSDGASFLIFSIYYAKTNRIVPIILTHLYCDVGSTLLYLF